jgi:hypothetical protein
MGDVEKLTTEGQFVYLYRDDKGDARYVGRGGKPARALSHTNLRGHNPELTAELLKSKKYSIEIAGPFGDEDIAALVEAALISALSDAPDFQLANQIGGVSRGRFRPDRRSIKLRLQKC